MISYDEARSQIAEHSHPLPSERLPLQQALGRHLAQEVTASVDSPPFDNSAVDGFALGPGEGPYRIVGEIAAGSSAPLDLSSGEAVRIFTGAPVPSGTTAIAMVEDCEIAGVQLTVTSKGDFIRPRGEDFAKGSVLAKAHDLVTPPLMGLLASAGIADLHVHKRPRVSLLTTGTEVRPLGKGLDSGQIYNSNGPALLAALESLGVTPTVRHVTDDMQATCEAVGNALQTSDVVLTCGGVSVGGHDYLKQAFADCSVEQVFWRVAIKPGKPLFFGQRAKTLVFGLPGNPVSSLVTFFLFARPALLALLGANGPFNETTEATLSDAIDKKPDRTEFMRGRLSVEQGQVKVRVSRGQGSHQLLGAGPADCLAIIAAEASHVPAGTRVRVVPMRWGLL